MVRHFPKYGKGKHKKECSVLAAIGEKWMKTIFGFYFNPVTKAIIDKSKQSG